VKQPKFNRLFEREREREEEEEERLTDKLCERRNNLQPNSN
jgi:hypothetical protein